MEGPSPLPLPLTIAISFLEHGFLVSFKILKKVDKKTKQISFFKGRAFFFFGGLLGNVVFALGIFDDEHQPREGGARGKDDARAVLEGEGQAGSNK